MINTIDIFKSKLESEKITGENNFFESIEEINESNKLQEKYISNVDYSNPENFARFGSAEEYYKNAISYISSEYPYDGSTENKYKWINSLNELEYYIFSKEYPRYQGYSYISGSQYIKFSLNQSEEEKAVTKQYYYNPDYNTINLNLSNGVTFESWLKFYNTSNATLTKIFELTSVDSLLNNYTVASLVRNNNDGQLFLSGSSFSHNLGLITDENWHHYAFTLNGSQINVFVDGTITVSSASAIFSSSQDIILTKSGALDYDLFSTNPSVSTFTHGQILLGVSPSGSAVCFDESRLWNYSRTVEQIGRNWFTSVNGNSDENNSSDPNLIFYYKFNEGWDTNYGFLCLDYSGKQNDGEIINYITSSRVQGSAINECGFVQDTEKKDIIFAGTKYSTVVNDYYNEKIEIGKEHDLSNIHMLYKKFPSWVLMDEDELSPKHLKQIIQIVSSYFDDLYNKISQVSEYKTIKYNSSLDTIYPFYDKILASTGFNIDDLFANLDIIEKAASRNETSTYDENIQKIKNSIFQSIYNNLSYILKSKGTEKSLKSFLRSYGVNEDLVRINLYSDGYKFNVVDRLKEDVVRKKTVYMNGDESIFLSSSIQEQTASFPYYTLETAVLFPAKRVAELDATGSIFGLQSNNTSSNDWSTNIYQYYVTLENYQNNEYKFILNDVSGNYAESSIIKDIYDDTVWNLAIRKKQTLDALTGAMQPINYNIELYGINTNTHTLREFSCSLPHTASDGYIKYYIGSRKQDLTGSLIHPTNCRFVYCNFWSDYLNNDIITSHNKDILNYGTDE
jgi:hypothetical protein